MKKLLAFLCALIFTLPLSFAFGCSVDQEEKPRHCYDISVVYDEVKHTLDCDMTVSYVNSSDAILSEAWFHLYPNAYRNGATCCPIDESMAEDAYVNGESYGDIEISSLSVGGIKTEYEIGGSDCDILVVPFAKDLEPTERVDISMQFTVKLANVRHRLGWVDSIANCGNFYPIACVKKESGFDAYPYYSNGDPFFSECADYKVSVTAPSTLVVALSGKSERTDNGVSATYKSEMFKSRDFAFVVGDFHQKTAKVSGVEVKYYYLKDTDAESSLKTACDAIEYFSKTLMQYPYVSYSVVETPFIHGGMEYPGLVLISDALNKSLTKEAIIHETAHQWWYGIVGNNEVEHAWMDEGLTEYSTTLFYEANPSYGVSYKARMADATAAYVIYSDVTTSDGAMDKNINEFTSYDYTYLTYLKGALMFDSLRKTVDDTAFFKALKEYCTAYAYKEATPEGMIASFEQSTSRKLKTVFDSFLYGKAQIF